MPYRDWRFRINDILEAIEKIERYTKGMDFDSWQSDEKTVDAVIRNIEVIGEASSHLPNEVLKQYDDIPWSLMKGIKNHSIRLDKNDFIAYIDCMIPLNGDMKLWQA